MKKICHIHLNKLWVRLLPLTILKLISYLKITNSKIIIDIIYSQPLDIQLVVIEYFSIFLRIKSHKNYDNYQMI